MGVPLARRSRNCCGVSSCAMLKHELLSLRGIDQGFDDGLEQALACPLRLVDTAYRDGVHHRRRTDDREQPSPEAQCALERVSYIGNEPVIAITSNSPSGVSLERVARFELPRARPARCAGSQPPKLRAPGRFDRTRRAPQKAQARGKVAGTGADLEHGVLRGHAQGLQYAALKLRCEHVLTEADRQAAHRRRQVPGNPAARTLRAAPSNGRRAHADRALPTCVSADPPSAAGPPMYP